MDSITVAGDRLFHSASPPCQLPSSTRRLLYSFRGTILDRHSTCKKKQLFLATAAYSSFSRITRHSPSFSTLFPDCGGVSFKSGKVKLRSSSLLDCVGCEEDAGTDGNGGGGACGGGNGGGREFWGWWRHDGDDKDNLGSLVKKILVPYICVNLLLSHRNQLLLTKRSVILFLLSLYGCMLHFGLDPAFAISSDLDDEKDVEGAIWEVRGGKWIKLIPDLFKDEFVEALRLFPSSASTVSTSVANLWMRIQGVIPRLLLPEGYPHSVTSDYMEYSLWRGVQGVASQISGVLATQVPMNYLVVLSSSVLMFYLKTI